MEIKTEKKKICVNSCTLDKKQINHLHTLPDKIRASEILGSRLSPLA
jgi:hypothetical protein